MTQALKDILANKWEEPSEMETIKKYIKREFNVSVSLSVHDKQITIHVHSAALAAALRMHLPELQKLTPAGKRPIIRIGN